MSFWKILFVFFWIILERCRFCRAERETQEIDDTWPIGEETVEVTMTRTSYLLNMRNGKFTLWRRIALVESSFGNNSMVMEANPEGGIWQVHQTQHEYMEDYFSDLTTTEETSNITMLDLIEEALNDSCFLCSYDYSEPLRSAMGARLFMELTAAPVHSTNVNEHATWWAERYHPGGNVSEFIERSLNYDIKTGYERHLKLDLWYLMDGSFYVQDEDYQRTMDFITSLSSEFLVSPDNVRLAYSTYFLHQYMHVWLKNGTSFKHFRSVVGNTTNPANTQTDSTLREVADVLMTPNDYRLDAHKFLVIITNERSKQDITEAIKYVHETNITTFAVGYGSSGRSFLKRLYSIASAPEDANSVLSATFENLPTLLHPTLLLQICRILKVKTIILYTKELVATDKSITFVDDLDRKIKSHFNVSCFMDCGDLISLQVRSILSILLKGLQQYNEVKNKLFTYVLMWFEIHFSASDTFEDCAGTKVTVWFLFDGILTFSEYAIKKVVEYLYTFSNRRIFSLFQTQVAISAAYDATHDILVDFNHSLYAERFRSALSLVRKPKFEYESGKALLKIIKQGFTNESGARISDAEVGRFLVKITDRVNKNNETEIMKLAKENNITLYYIIVGNEEAVKKGKKLGKEFENVYWYHVSRFDQLPTLKLHILATLYKQREEALRNLLPKLSENTAVSLTIGKGESLYLVATVTEDKVVTLKFFSGSKSGQGVAYSSIFFPKPSAEFHDQAFQLQKGLLNITFDPAIILKNHPYIVNSENNSTKGTFQVYLTITNTGNFPLQLSLNSSASYKDTNETTTKMSTTIPIVISTEGVNAANFSPVVLIIPVLLLLMISGMLLLYFVTMKKKSKRAVKPLEIPATTGEKLPKRSLSLFKKSSNNKKSIQDIYEYFENQYKSKPPNAERRLSPITARSNSLIPTVSVKSKVFSYKNFEDMCIAETESLSLIGDSSATSHSYGTSLDPVVTHVKNVVSSRQLLTESTSTLDKYLEHLRSDGNKRRGTITKELKENLEALLEKNAAITDIMDATTEFENYLGHSSQDDENAQLLKKAKWLTISKTIDYLKNLTKEAVSHRDPSKVKLAMDEIEGALQACLSQSQIQNDIELHESIDAVKSLYQVFFNMEQATISLLEVLSPMIPEITIKADPNIGIRNVLEAIFIVLGENKKKLMDWNNVCIMLRTEGELSFENRVKQLDITHITVDQALDATRILRDPVYIKAKKRDPLVSCIHGWLLMILDEVKDRHSSLQDLRDRPSKVW